MVHNIRRKLLENYLIFDTEYPIERHKLDKNLVAFALKTKNDLSSTWIYQDNCGKLIEKYWLIDQEWDEIEILVGHNIKADLLKIWDKPFLQNAFKKGLKIWDTSLVHYMLSGQQEIYPELRDIAVRCYGCKPREKEMKTYWDKKVSTENIPKKIVLKDVENDVIDTEQVYLKQLDQAGNKNMFNLVEVHMDFLLATCEIEYNGMYIDLNILNKNKQILDVELQKQLSKLQELIIPYWKEV